MSKAPRIGAIVRDDLRQQIVAGRFSPGARLPTREELWKRYGTTPVTMQRVFSQLMKEGFIVSRGWEGTFVAERPPHLNSFALVFPYKDRPGRRWPEFWRAMEREAVALARERGHELHFSYGNETHEDREAYLQLEEDVLAHRVAGLIFATPPDYLRGSPVLDVPGIPRVAISPAPMPPNVKAVTLGGTMFTDAIDCLVQAGRRRIAVVTVPPVRDMVASVLRDAGVAVPPYWIQTSTYDDTEGARRAVQLLMAGRPGERPDGLFVFDDNLVESATAGLLDAHVRVPEEVLVVAHCNFPRPTPSLVPARRIGHDVCTLLRRCVELIEMQRRGEPAPDLSVVASVWSEGTQVGARQ